LYFCLACLSPINIFLVVKINALSIYSRKINKNITLNTLQSGLLNVALNLNKTKKSLMIDDAGYYNII